MKNWLMITCLLLLFAGCTKYTTPKKVEKRISKGTWKISSFSINNVSVTTNYQNYTFGFSEDGHIKVGGSISATGAWEVGLNKNPAILYLSFPPVGGLEYLADDWQVTDMQKDVMKLQRNDDSGDSGSLVFSK